MPGYLCIAASCDSTRRSYGTLLKPDCPFYLWNVPLEHHTTYPKDK